MTIECLISFDNNPQGVFYAGQELSGTVDFNVDTTRRIKAIHITIKGYAKVRWIKKGYRQDSERAACRAFKLYLSSKSFVLGSNNNHQGIFDWLAGEYTYSFHIILPENLPTSFEGKFGQIQYEIIVTIDRPGRSSKVYKLPFTVIQSLDLNCDPLYRTSLDILDRKRFWNFCCPSGPLVIKFSTPYCGYAPGQKINFVLYVNNESSIDITECEVKLKQEVVYESSDPQHEFRSDKSLIAFKIFGNVLRWSRKVYRDTLDLPSIPPTLILAGCPITVTYFIKIIVKPTDFHYNQKLKIPLTIGSIPIMDITPIDNLIQPNAPDIQLINDPETPPEYTPMIPPSYEDAIAVSDRFIDDVESVQFVSTSSISSDRVCNFTPRYPVYSNFTTPSMPPDTNGIQSMIAISETEAKRTKKLPKHF